MGQSAMPGQCSSMDVCSSIGEGGREQISASSSSSVRESKEEQGTLQEKTYITSRADADTALPISVRSQAPTARMTPRHELAPTGSKDNDQDDFWRPGEVKSSGFGHCALAAVKVPAPTGVALSKVSVSLPTLAEEPVRSELVVTNDMNPQEGLLD